MDTRFISITTNLKEYHSYFSVTQEKIIEKFLSTCKEYNELSIRVLIFHIDEIWQDLAKHKHVRVKSYFKLTSFEKVNYYQRIKNIVEQELKPQALEKVTHLIHSLFLYWNFQQILKNEIEKILSYDKLWEKYDYYLDIDFFFLSNPNFKEIQGEVEKMISDMHKFWCNILKVQNEYNLERNQCPFLHFDIQVVVFDFLQSPPHTTNFDDILPSYFPNIIDSDKKKLESLVAGCKLKWDQSHIHKMHMAKNVKKIILFEANFATITKKSIFLHILYPSLRSLYRKKKNN